MLASDNPVGADSPPFVTLVARGFLPVHNGSVLASVCNTGLSRYHLLIVRLLVALHYSEVDFAAMDVRGVGEVQIFPRQNAC